MRIVTLHSIRDMITALPMKDDMGWNECRLEMLRQIGTIPSVDSPIVKMPTESDIFNILHNTVIGLQDKGDGSRDFMTKGDANKLATAISALLRKGK